MMPRSYKMVLKATRIRLRIIATDCGSVTSMLHNFARVLARLVKVALFGQRGYGHDN